MLAKTAGRITYVVTYDRPLDTAADIQAALQNIPQLRIDGAVYPITRIVKLKTPVKPTLVGKGISFHKIDDDSQDDITNQLARPECHSVLYNKLM